MKLTTYKNRVRKLGVYLSLYPGNQSSNWDGTWWLANWSDQQYADHINISARKKDHGLRWCRTLATEKAFINRAKMEGIEIEL